MEDKKVETKVESITLSELLKRKLAIPEYQRPYQWGTYEIDKLVRQIKAHNEKKGEKPLYYLGSIVLHEKDGFLKIIDGQQRITSLALISFINNAEDFGIGFNNPVSKQNIINNYLHYTIEENRDKISGIDFDNINVSIVITQSEDDAYNFFETLNTGGVRLSGVHILKAHHLRSLTHDKVDFYAKAWEKKQASLDEVVKHLIRARRWKVPQVPMQEFPDFFSSDDSAWKKVIIEEFSEKTEKDTNSPSIGYQICLTKGNVFELIGNKYAIQQDLTDGENFIEYLLSYVEIYETILKELTSLPIHNIVNQWDQRGSEYLKTFYQLCLFCYLSKWGIEKINEASLLLFRCIYSVRVVVNTRVNGTNVLNLQDTYRIIYNILLSISEKQTLKWLINGYTYTPSIIKWYDNGVKKRHIERVQKVFKLTEYPSPENFDYQLKTAIQNLLNNQINKQ